MLTINLVALEVDQLVQVLGKLSPPTWLWFLSVLRPKKQKNLLQFENLLTIFLSYVIFSIHLNCLHGLNSGLVCKRCWLESSFVGTKPLESPQTPIIDNSFTQPQPKSRHIGPMSTSATNYDSIRINGVGESSISWTTKPPPYPPLSNIICRNFFSARNF